MLVQIDSMKEILGMPLTADPVEDPILERSSVMAQMLVEAYIRTPLEQDPSAPKNYTRFQLEGVRLVRLPEFPAAITSVKVDDVTLPAAEYTYDSKTAILMFLSQRYSVSKLEIDYLPGFTSETTPPDLLGVITNIAIAIYENGGKIAAASSSGALKSMTMFDAMSMSFETGNGTTSAASGPEAMVSQWAFVLDSYKVDKYVMGSQ